MAISDEVKRGLEAVFKPLEKPKLVPKGIPDKICLEDVCKITGLEMQNLKAQILIYANSVNYKIFEENKPFANHTLISTCFFTEYFRTARNGKWMVRAKERWKYWLTNPKAYTEKADIEKVKESIEKKGTSFTPEDLKKLQKIIELMKEQRNLLEEVLGIRAF